MFFGLSLVISILIILIIMIMFMMISALLRLFLSFFWWLFLVLFGLLNQVWVGFTPQNRCIQTEHRRANSSRRWAKDRGICHAAKGYLSPYHWSRRMVPGNNLDTPSVGILNRENDDTCQILVPYLIIWVDWNYWTSENTILLINVSFKAGQTNHFFGSTDIFLCYFCCLVFDDWNRKLIFHSFRQT